MQLFMDILLMLGGVAVFMYGMKQMSQGMEQGVGSGVRKLFKKINKSRLIDYGIGISATAVVQSSSATSIMTVGLANAGIVTVKQGSGIVLGAKVGTTLTAFIFALGVLSKGSFSISALFCAVAFVGVVIIFTTNNPSWKKLSLFLIGFGMLFVGLEVMEFAIGGKDSILSTELAKLFEYEVMQNPILLVLLGIVFTCVIQSSSAATGVFIALLSTGVIKGVDQSFFLIMGANIGTCSDGIMASLGTNENGKRIAFFHVLTSVIGAAFFMVVLVIFRKPITELFESVFTRPEWSLATFNLIYNLIYTLILLIFLDPLVKFVCRVIKKQTIEIQDLQFIDERLLATPMIAVEQSLKEVYAMANMAQNNIDRAFEGMINGDMSDGAAIAEQEYKIDNTTKALAGYFIKLSASSISLQDDKLIAGLHHVINDIERIGDYAVQLAKETNYMLQIDTQFLPETKQELTEIHQKISKLFALALETFQSRNVKNLKQLADIHYEINEQITAVKDIHVKRLSSNLYPVEVSKSLYTALISLQRVADHVVNIGFSIKSETGSKTEAFAKLAAKESKAKPEPAKKI